MLSAALMEMVEWGGAQRAPTLPAQMDATFHDLARTWLQRASYESVGEGTWCARYAAPAEALEDHGDPTLPTARTSRNRLRHMRRNAGTMARIGSRIFIRTSTASNIITVKPPADSSSSGRE